MKNSKFKAAILIIILIAASACRTHRQAASSIRTTSLTTESLFSHFRLSLSDSISMNDSIILSLDSIRIRRPDSTAITISKATLSRNLRSARQLSSTIDHADTLRRQQSSTLAEARCETSTTESARTPTWLALIILSIALSVIAVVILRKIANFAAK